MAPRFEIDPDDGWQYRPSLDDILLLALASATLLGAST